MKKLQRHGHFPLLRDRTLCWPQTVLAVTAAPPADISQLDVRRAAPMLSKRNVLYNQWFNYTTSEQQGEVVKSLDRGEWSVWPPCLLPRCPVPWLLFATLSHLQNNGGLQIKWADVCAVHGTSPPRKHDGVPGTRCELQHRAASSGCPGRARIKNPSGRVWRPAHDNVRRTEHKRSHGRTHCCWRK